MPIYEYQCTRCGHREEHIQRLDDPPRTVCEECGGELKKLVSAPAFQFKGTGWYVTDYAGKKGGESKEAKGSGGGDAGKDSGGDSAKESKSSDGADKSGGAASAGESKSGDGGSKAGTAPPPSKPAASE